ncbi:MAG: hypothetical protein NVSMB42_16870 [Herpetosiphon sp.]
MVSILGGGPAGLPVAHALQKRGIPYQILERGSVGNAWLHHYERLHLHTLKQVSALPDFPMPANYPAFPDAHQFQSYLREYARHFQLNMRTEVEVSAARWAAPRRQLTTNRGPIAASILVAATGI